MYNVKSQISEILKENDDVINSAVELFGYTHNPLEAGFIIPSGKMLDLSGRHQAGGYSKQANNTWKRSDGKDDFTNLRLVDHRDELYDLIGSEQGLDNSEYVDDVLLIYFMEKYNIIRVMPNHGFSIIVKPTPAQIKTMLFCASTYFKDHRYLVLYVDRLDRNFVALSHIEITPTTLGKLKPWLEREFQSL